MKNKLEQELESAVHDEELKSIKEFIRNEALCTTEDCVEIIQCMLVYENLLAFNPPTRLLCRVLSAHVNGKCVQLNLQGEE